jgi:hypothetical protein
MPLNLVVFHCVALFQSMLKFVTSKVTILLPLLVGTGGGTSPRGY